MATKLALVSLLGPMASSASAFVVPGPAAFGPARARPAVTSSRIRASPTVGLSSLRMAATSPVDVQAERLREQASQLRAEAAALQAQMNEEKQGAALRSFNTFDSNGDGQVDVAELRAGLERVLRRDFVKRLKARMGGVPPTARQVEAKIAEMPGGRLLPEEPLRKLLEAYDKNGDGVLQPEEFARTEELRARLEAIFQKQQEEDRLSRVAEWEKTRAEKERETKVEMARSLGVALPEDFNDDAPTALDRAASGLPYLLPLLDGLVFAGHLFSAYPEQLAWAQPLLALLVVYRSIPFSGLAAFFGMQFLAGKPEVNKLVRFNLRQAINLDIALFFPTALASLAALVGGGGGGGADSLLTGPLAQTASDAVFVTVLAAIAYSVGSSALGVIPNKIPVIGAMNRENPEREGGGDGPGHGGSEE